MGWADGLASTLGVCAVFLMVGLVFSQSSFSNQQARLLDEYEMPFAVEGEKLENVSRLRDEITAENRSFTTSMLVGAAVPMSIFVLSMVRLFTKSSEKD